MISVAKSHSARETAQSLIGMLGFEGAAHAASTKAVAHAVTGARDNVEFWIEVLDEISETNGETHASAG